MKLKSFQVGEFRSIYDTGPIELEQTTCLVGKNEAGKTAILQALYRLNPLVSDEGSFDVTDDYPRRNQGEYTYQVEEGKRSHATVVDANFELEEKDLSKLEPDFGPDIIGPGQLKLEKGYSNQRVFELDVDLEKARKQFVHKADVTETVRTQLEDTKNWVEIQTALYAADETGEITRLRKIVDHIASDGLSHYLYNSLLKSGMPKFLYFDEYYQMKGRENIPALLKRQQEGKLEKSDHPLLGLMDLARLKIERVVESDRTADVKNQLEGAGNHLTSRILKYWSQNQHIKLQFDVREGRPNDPAGMQSGMNIWGDVYDQVHWATTELSSRSKGFLWFFSFLAWYESVKKSDKDLILLLDEPGLSLHGRAQEDLLRYMENELAPDHQIIYSTHSPFMVDPAHFERVRIVQDFSIDAKEPIEFEEGGTKVLTDVYDATEDSLFPLQGALGYELHQTLFIGPNSLVVEGASDMLYLKDMSVLLEREGRVGLDPKWTITPVGGSGKVPTFVALLAPQKGMNIAVLIDIQDEDRQGIENLYKKKLLQKKRVLTYADFLDSDEADIEDLFDRELYVSWVNKEYAPAMDKSIAMSDLNDQIPRIVRALEKHFEQTPMKKQSFGHYRPARYFSENFVAEAAAISDVTKDRFEAIFKQLNALLK